MKGSVIAIISAPGVGASFLTKQIACRHSAPAFFEGETGIFTASVLEILNNEIDSAGRYDWTIERTTTMLERARAIADIGITSYVDGDVLLLEAWLEAEIGKQSPPVLKKWIEGSRHLMADKVIVLSASDEKIKENITARGRASEQTDFIKKRAIRVAEAYKNIAQSYSHVAFVDRTDLDFCNTESLEYIDRIIDKLPTKESA